jgi:putative SOS response-associated peptidase YedK
MFDAEADDDLPDGGYNVAPTDTIRIALKQDGQPRLTAARWGLLPFWAGGGTKQRAPGWINARAETALDSPAFGAALRRVAALSRWMRSMSGIGASPHASRAIGSADDGLLALAGVCSPPSDSALPSAAILTTSPNELLSPIHNRMPVICPVMR